MNKILAERDLNSQRMTNLHQKYERLFKTYPQKVYTLRSFA